MAIPIPLVVLVGLGACARRAVIASLIETLKLNDVDPKPFPRMHIRRRSPEPDR
jgi:hypothetical protein